MPCGTLGAQLSPLLSVVIRTHTHTYAHANTDRRIGKVVLKDWLILAHWNTDRNFPSDMWQEWTHGVFYNLNNDLVLSIVLYIFLSVYPRKYTFPKTSVFPHVKVSTIWPCSPFTIALLTFVIMLHWAPKLHGCLRMAWDTTRFLFFSLPHMHTKSDTSRE